MGRVGERDEIKELRMAFKTDAERRAAFAAMAQRGAAEGKKAGNAILKHHETKVKEKRPPGFPGPRKPFEPTNAERALQGATEIRSDTTNNPVIMDVERLRIEAGKNFKQWAWETAELAMLAGPDLRTAVGIEVCSAWKNI